MICSYCGGQVTWRGPLSSLTHTECSSCGGQNCQVVSVEYPDEQECDDCGALFIGEECSCQESAHA